MKAKLEEHLQTYAPISQQQWGFMSSRSSISALIQVVDNWAQALDQGYEMLLIEFPWTVHLVGQNVQMQIPMSSSAGSDLIRSKAAFLLGENLISLLTSKAVSRASRQSLDCLIVSPCNSEIECMSKTVYVMPLVRKTGSHFVLAKNLPSRAAVMQR